MKCLKHIFWTTGAASTLLAAVSAHASAATPAILSTNLPAYTWSPAITIVGNGGTIGWAFTVGSGVNLTVYDLGLFDSGNASLSTDHPVAMWDSNSNLLAEVTIPSGVGANYRSGYTYEQLSSPLALTAGSTYYIGAYYPSGCSDLVLVTGTNQQFSPDITWLDPRQSVFNPSQTSIAFPDIYNSPTGTYKEGWFGPNFDFTAATVPEPGTLALTAAGFASLLAFRRRK